MSSPDEITRERLEAEATLLDSVVRETECEAVTEREDTYEVIIDSKGERRPELYSIGAQYNTIQYNTRPSPFEISASVVDFTVKFCCEASEPLRQGLLVS